MPRPFFFCALLLLSLESPGQPRSDGFLREIFDRSGDSLLRQVLDDPATYRYQIIYTEINRDKRNRPSFVNYYLNVDPYRYFNPASTVKMPLAFLALEKLNKLRSKGIDKFTPVQFDSGWHRQTIAWTDSSSENGLPTMANYIRKVFLISDNDAYNRLYEFLGQQTINRRLHELGYPEARITRRFTRMNAEENRHSNPIRFIGENGSLIYHQPMEYNRDSFDFSRTVRMGNAHYDANDSLVHEPIDFTTANNMPLENLQQMLRSVMFPNSVPRSQRFTLRPGDYQFLYRFLSQYPSETAYPKYDTSEYYDSYVKFFFRDSTRRMPGHVRVFNKVGWAYGCLTDVSYVADFKNKVEFMLAITIYVNSDGVLNDDRYDYKTIGWPFLYKAGQAIYRHELARRRENSPDLSAFRLNYITRPDDSRPAIKGADN